MFESAYGAAALGAIFGGPAVAFGFLLVAGRRLGALAGGVATLGALVSAAGALWAAGMFLRSGEVLSTPVFLWLAPAGGGITFGLQAGGLGLWMAVLVGLVAFFVHLYSLGYMKGDPRQAVYFQHLSFFTAAMQGLVLSGNLLQFYVFWELVGLASFLLIGFDVHRPAARRAAMKAFLVTRFGDIGLFIALWIVYVHVGSFRFDDLFRAVETGALSPPLLTALALLLFLGAMGKSGQFPLHVWLPDAMEGPTPVSALIHAATMVAAGVYLVAVMEPVFSASPVAQAVVAGVGAWTALYAAVVAVAQTDMKRVLAYSTVSQLGFMMHALGVGSVYAALFHLSTHAFFKALLFLGAGAVYHAAGTYDLTRLGGLGRKMPFTTAAFAVGALALVGLPPLSGFFSKERILAASWTAGSGGAGLLLGTTLITALYVGRLLTLAFFSPARTPTPAPLPPLPATMAIAVAALALFAAFAGGLESERFGAFARMIGEPPPSEAPAFFAALSTALGLFGLLLGATWVRRRLAAIGRTEAAADGASFGGFSRAVRAGFGVDALIVRGIGGGAMAVGRALAAVDRGLFEGIVALVVAVVRGLGFFASRLADGRVQRYNLIAVLILLFFLVVWAVSG
ncbi:MAG: NADH-ubiquinone oxidoreductase chain L [Hydrogenibacillus schlegelii]|uniref:NADH-ubiquinone oxidoreductase chain L n=1 Tax=Hydrogenibacillus schlegelii TaxID=1484 RepID=A0A2T5GFM5_HYDSH|nr:NADH-quinone oxidoreductase subunit L [Hydrogenibacillus schlegelii]PTQ54992.1 MAG: NADH-ubiquinone oxidoreductase chain L [Hydrogenibacillus schlegelii]